jgi:glyoxylase-like metal-dependent hydrolase (beta-lactamase superfamily II)
VTGEPPRRPRKQEQEPASPEPTELAPGVLRLQIPINFTGLGHVNSYALVDSRGATIVDAGLPGSETWSAIRQRLRSAELRLQDVHTVLVTHSHPDHFGSAGRLAHAAGADLVAERRFHTWFERMPHTHVDASARGTSGEGHPTAAGTDPGTDPDQAEEDDTGYLGLIRARRTPWGGSPFPTNRRQKIVRRLATRGLVPSMRPPIPTRRVDDGDTLTFAGREWRAVHTPGHTGDHLCLYDPADGLLISGDHVLPTITPHVGGLSPLRDPLGSFLVSLARLLDIGPVRLVLPAHGHPFEDLQTRIDQIVDHHDDRLRALREIGRGGRQTVVEMSQQLFHRPLWGMMAESETYAHLEFLRLRGEAERVRLEDDQLSYSVDPEGSSSARSAAFGAPGAPGASGASDMSS